MIGSNMNRTLKAFDFRGYSPRKDINAHMPAINEKRFIMPEKLCPTINTKYKVGGVPDLGKYAARTSRTDQPRDAMSSVNSPSKSSFTTMLKPGPTVAPPISNLYSEKHGYKVIVKKTYVLDKTKFTKNSVM